MRLTEITYSEAKPIDGYGPDFYRIGGQAHAAPLAVLPGGISGWGGFADTATLIVAAGEIDVLFVGTGPEMTAVPAAFRTALEEAGIGIEPMNSPTACRTYNILLSEGRRIGLALLPAGAS